MRGRGSGRGGRYEALSYGRGRVTSGRYEAMRKKLEAEVPIAGGWKNSRFGVDTSQDTQINRQVDSSKFNLKKKGRIVTEDNIEIGMKVVRGRDWTHGTQDRDPKKAPSPTVSPNAQSTTSASESGTPVSHTVPPPYVPPRARSKQNQNLAWGPNMSQTSSKQNRVSNTSEVTSSTVYTGTVIGWCSTSRPPPTDHPTIEIDKSCDKGWARVRWDGNDYQNNYAIGYLDKFSLYIADDYITQAEPLFDKKKKELTEKPVPKVKISTDWQTNLQMLNEQVKLLEDFEIIEEGGPDLIIATELENIATEKAAKKEQILRLMDKIKELEEEVKELEEEEQAYHKQIETESAIFQNQKKIVEENIVSLRKQIAH